MNVLWVSSHIADPTLGGGWAYEYELLVHAATHHRVTVVSGELEAGAPAPAVLTDLGVEVVGAHVPMRPVPRNKLQFLSRLATASEPSGAWLFEPVRTSMAAALARVQSSGQFDLVQVFPQESAPLVAASAGPTALLLGDSYAVQADREQRAARSTKDKLRLTLERRAARRYERRWYPQADAVACVSSADAAVLRDLCGIEVDVVPVGVGDEWFAPPTERSHDLVVLVGALDYLPNVDGTVWFCDEAWPHVRERAPHARLRVVGRRPPPEVRRAVADAGGELLADVPDVRPHYWEAAVAVAPTRLGSGVKNKVLHAAACQAPQVGTVFAFDGTDAVAGRDALMADDARGIADAVVATLADPAGARERADAARQVALRHSRQAAGAALDAFWARALGRKPAP